MPVEKTLAKYFGVAASFFGYMTSKISIFDFFTLGGVSNFGVKKCRNFL